MSIGVCLEIISGGGRAAGLMAPGLLRIFARPFVGVWGGEAAKSLDGAGDERHIFRDGADNDDVVQFVEEDALSDSQSMPTC
jgi:hypothetical protein